MLLDLLKIHIWITGKCKKIIKYIKGVFSYDLYYSRTKNVMYLVIVIMTKLVIYRENLLLAMFLGLVEVPSLGVTRNSQVWLSHLMSQI